MSLPDRSTIVNLLNNGPNRSEVGRKQLTIAFGGKYIASTNGSSKPQLVWETEKPYPRYYLPVASLNDDIAVHINGTVHDSNGTIQGTIQVENVENIKGKSNESEAVVELLTVGSKSTTWVRFLKGPLEGFIRFERNDLDDWFENGALFSSIKNPYKRIDTATISSHIIIKVDSEEVAESNVAVLLNETGLKETYYIPATSIKNWASVSKSDLRTVCPYKGEARYLSLTVNGTKYDNLIWYYPYPTHESAAVEGLISFYNKDNVEISVDGLKI